MICFGVVILLILGGFVWSIYLYLPVFSRVVPLALGQSCDCPSASEITLKGMGKMDLHWIRTSHCKARIMCIIYMYITVTSWWARWRLKSPASQLFTQPFIRVQIKENIKAPRHWPLCGEFTGDRWIPRTNGQWHGKCCHLMTSSWCPEFISWTCAN